MQSGTVADIAAVVDNCAVALQEAEEMAGFRPTQVVIGIAGELVKGFTTTHSQERKKPDVPITEAELQRLIDLVSPKGVKVVLARHFAGNAWQSLSIPKGKSKEFDVSKSGKPYPLR